MSVLGTTRMFFPNFPNFALVIVVVYNSWFDKRNAMKYSNMIDGLLNSFNFNVEYYLKYDRSKNALIIQYK